MRGGQGNLHTKGLSTHLPGWQNKAKETDRMVMLKRIIAIAFIYFCVVIAWIILGGTVQYRTTNQDSELKQAVGQLWGTLQQQRAPSIYYQTKENVTIKEISSTDSSKTIEKVETRVSTTNLPLEESDIKAGLTLDQRRKGLLWYSTYKVSFAGKYRVKNTTEARREIFFSFSFPSQGSVYDDFSFSVDGKKIENIEFSSGNLIHSMLLNPQQESIVEITYHSQGLDEWWYMFGDNVTQIKNFSLVMDTDFNKIDFPQNSVSPTGKEQTARGWKLTWAYKNLLSGVQIGMVMPKKLNPGPWVSKVTYFAPVSLFLFFFLTMIFSTLKQVKLHPIHYFFMGAAFFSYHLLLAYLVDHVSIHLSFWICSVVSIFLVLSYMRIVTGVKFAFLEIGLSQVVFLVFFSYTFFFEGYTGLTITILCIITLFIVMQMTARLDWEKVFGEKN